VAWRLSGFKKVLVSFRQAPMVRPANGQELSAGAAIHPPMKRLRTLTVTLAAALVTTIAAAETPTETHNRELVVSFYQQLFGDKDITAIDRYVEEGYIQHNPTVPAGRAAIKELFGKYFVGAPKTKVDIRRVAASGDLVWLHIRAPMPNGSVSAVVDIFRVQGDRIVEHWDVIHQVPEKAANDNTMF
jgi:predicted SnoaL-like aldol condensation-catalyzing enzyme